MQDIEFTIQEGKLYMLQCRNGKRTGTAALNMAMDMLAEKLIDAKTAVCRVEPTHLDQLLHPFVDPAAEKTAKVVAKGLPAGPGGASGAIVFTAQDAGGGIAAGVHWLPSVYVARLAVVDGEIQPNNLRLLRLVPLAWLRTDQPARFEQIPTCDGPVNLTAKLADSGKTLQVHFAGAFHTRPSRVVLHAPPIPGLKSIQVNGKTRSARKETELKDY